MKKYCILLLSFLCSNAFGQIFNQKDLLPGVKTVKTNQFNGCGVGFWNLKHYDVKGRMLLEELYRNRKLLGQHSYAYDENNNELSFISLYDINHPGVIDTVTTTTYEYDENRQILKEIATNGGNTYTIERTNISDNQTSYRLISKIIWHDRDTINFDTINFKLTYDVNHLVDKQIKEDKENGIYEITEYQYYTNGEMKRRKITRIPEPETLPFI